MAKNGFFKKTFRRAKAAASKKYEEYKEEHPKSLGEKEKRLSGKRYFQLKEKAMKKEGKQYERYEAKKKHQTGSRAKRKAYKQRMEKRITSKAEAASYQERETQAIRYARESAKYKTSQRLKAMKKPGTSFSQGLSYITGPTTLKGKGSGSSINRMLGTSGGNGMNTLLFGSTGRQPRSKTKMVKGTTYVKTKGGYVKKTVYKKKKSRAKPRRDPLNRMMGI